ncbi:MAG: TlpA family protein disulfide reductase [Bacteroidales bacterium]|nr:TlpA family protein disulfide reductase [Bacteroidales bacterium]
MKDSNQNLIVASQRKVTDSSVNNEKEKHVSSSNSRDMLSDILQKHKGKVIYLDIWATWCKPCISCMPSTKNLQEEFENKKVSFVFFCVQSKKDDWKTHLTKYKMPGDHYLLNDIQYTSLNDKLQITAMPRYVLIDKNGKIANEKALSPGLGGYVNKNLIEEINNLLTK